MSSPEDLGAVTVLNPVARYCVEDGIAVITIDNPPVNALGHAVRTGVAEGLDLALADNEVCAVVLRCAGRTFFAGADINEFGRPMASPVLRELALIMERAAKPIVAAIHGTALGGGLETALACHWRIAAPSAKLGLPEVKLGLLAGAGGTQRLPRLVGAEKALSMVVSGEPIGAPDALRHGLVDAIAGDDLRSDAIGFAKRVSAGGSPLRRVRDLPPAPAMPSLFTRFRSDHAERLRGFEAPEASIRCIEAAVTTSFDEGMRIERELFEALMVGTQCAAQRYAFFAERDAAKPPGVKGARPTAIETLIVRAGAGVPAGLAERCCRAGIRLVEEGAGVDGVEAGAAWFLDLDAGRVFAGTFAGDAILATTAGGMDAVVCRFAPSAAVPRLFELLLSHRLSGAESASLIALAKRLGLPVVVTLSGKGLIGERMGSALARACEVERSAGLAPGLASAADRFGLDVGGSGTRGTAPDAAALDRVVLAQINEGVRLLEEGAAARASDIDVACMKLGLWKAYRGGPMFHADQIGLGNVISALHDLEAGRGSEYAPSPLLDELVRAGATLHSYQQGARHG